MFCRFSDETWMSQRRADMSCRSAVSRGVASLRAPERGELLAFIAMRLLAAFGLRGMAVARVRANGARVNAPRNIESFRQSPWSERTVFPARPRS